MARISAPKFKSGDKVQLKSGGPVMTVEQVNTHAFRGTKNNKFTGAMTLSWFDGARVQTASMPQGRLKAPRKVR